MSTDSDRGNSQGGLPPDSSTAGKNDLSDAPDLRSLNNSWLGIEIFVKANHPELLRGLDQWLQLDLISPGQVKKLCRNHLSCNLPETLEVVESIPQEIKSSVETDSKVLVETTKSPSIFSTILQSFLDELSIRWLLFVGIFLVIISSGVLAATQWQNFPALGQYLVLLIYTVGFWSLGYWTSKQSGLKLTSKTLNKISLLLIPINFWAINYLSLGKNLLEWLIIIIAIVSLSVSTLISFKLKKNKAICLLFLGLSYLHLGWNIPWFSLAAIYAGIAIIIIFNQRLLPFLKKDAAFDLLFILATWSLLLVRVLITEVDQTANYCLAIALLAWLLATVYLKPVTQDNLDVNQQDVTEITRHFFSQVFYAVGMILLIVAWSVSVVSGITESSLWFWQTTGISLLIINLFYQRLICYWRKVDLTAIFLLGLQTLYLTKELIPDGLRLQAIDLSIAITNTEYFPESLLGVTLFPYVILFIWVATWLYQRQKTRLAIHAEYLTLFLGITLTCLSIPNPTWRSLNLLLSTLTLIWVAQLRQPIRGSLVYLAHLLGLVTVINGVNFVAPNLNQPFWGIIFTLLATTEWTIYLRLSNKPKIKFSFWFRQSCWYFGLLLSAISYVSFLNHLKTSGWALIWLIIPVMLTLIAKSSRSLRQRRLSTTLSCLALVGVQLITFTRLETRIIALTVAVALMFINAFNLRRTLVTALHLGFVIGLIASLFYSFISPNFANIHYWLLLGGVITLGLYQLRIYLLKISNTPKFDYVSQRQAHGILGVGVETKNFKLINKYLNAVDYWAIAIIIWETLIISMGNFAIRDFQSNFPSLITLGILGAAIFWRYRQQPNNYVVYILVWLGELLTVGLLGLFNSNGLIIATANIFLGLITLRIVAKLNQTNSAWARLNLAFVPLTYAVCGIIWRLAYFNIYTGLLILGVAFILLNTKLQNNRLQTLLNYGGVASISLGIYELVTYQILYLEVSVADSLTILAFVAAAIAFCYRLSAYLIASTPSNQRQIFNLTLNRVVLVAHIHWAISSMLKIIGAGIAIENTTPRLTLLSIATSFCLAGYAVIQGRENQNNQHQDWWVYVGLVELAATLVYSRLIISRLSLFDPWRVIFTCAVALLIYQIPWQNFGWRATPWRHTALIIPALMALVTAEDISAFSLVITALFYLRIAYAQTQIRWSYISLGFINWLIIKFVWLNQGNFMVIAAMISCSILYVAQIDPYYQFRRQPRHYLRLLGSSILCIAALLYQPLITPGIISFSLIFLGLGLKIRAFLFAGTITLILTAINQLIILVLTYSFLKWVVGLLAGISSIAIAARFEGQRDRAFNQLNNYRSRLQNWH
ncbi:MAG: hypothetical protein AAGE84_13155 [Cyanobacteria bacterium P01_G01_bin.39]